MAKSLRSKSKVKSRNIKRYNDKTDYNIIQNARLAATSSRLAHKNKHGKTLAEDEADEAEGVTGDEKMGEASTATAEDDSAAVATENGWYQRIPPLQHSQVLKEKVANQQDEAKDISFVLLGLCDPDSISLATIEADGPGQSSGHLDWLLGDSSG